MNEHYHWRWLGWAVWSNAITLLQIAQAAVAAVMIYAEAFPHKVFRELVIANAVLTAVIAQIKRNNPPGPPPERRDEPDTDPARNLS